MSAQFPIPRVAISALVVLAIGGLASRLSNAIQESQTAIKDVAVKASPPTDDPPKQFFSGKVVILQDALKRRGVKAFDEFKTQVALETGDGELIPIVPDWRGQAFFQDERLRDRRVELVGTRQKAAPYLQVQMVFVFDVKGTRQYLDYWCDICSIAMYELKPCDCCQEKIRLRLQPQELPEFVKKKSH